MEEENIPVNVEEKNVPIEEPNKQQKAEIEKLEEQKLKSKFPGIDIDFVNINQFLEQLSFVGLSP